MKHPIASLWVLDTVCVIVDGGVVISLPLDLQGVTLTDAYSLTCPARGVMLVATQPLSRSQGH
jgi:hypothetical protein